ncbi:hypothetical protein COCNU_03G005460 [Cocos nucifera]|uniref:Uncharacterized protein n=1 Tax=Cocos nucifera TaxID=13894 RepID=A0A8K0I224_COCNU|nr:hypothetical protein COCNU_03G005460 [Cocos nucifera]
MDLVEAASGKEAKKLKEEKTTEIKPEAVAERETEPKTAAEDESALHLSLKAATTAESSSRLVSKAPYAPAKASDGMEASVEGKSQIS